MKVLKNADESLRTRTDPSTTLLARFQGFYFLGQEVKIPISAHDDVREKKKPFEQSHSFNHSAADEAMQVQIGVMFL